MRILQEGPDWDILRTMMFQWMPSGMSNQDESDDHSDLVL